MKPSSFEEQRALLQTLDDTWSLAEARAYLDLIPGLQGDDERALQLCQTRLSFYRDAGQTGGIAKTLLTLAFITLTKGDTLHAIAAT